MSKPSLFKKSLQSRRPTGYEGDKIGGKQELKIRAEEKVSFSFLDTITFGILSPEEILSLSVCKIDDSSLNGKGTVYDERMGIIEDGKECPTCELSSKDCPGHFGHIELNVPIIHPLYYKHVLPFLKAFCFKCHSPLLTRDQIDLSGFFKYSRESRMNKILKKIEKIEICWNCKTLQPRYIYSVDDSTIFISYKKNKETIKIPLSTDDIRIIFEDIRNEDISNLGYDPQLIHPKNFILSMIPVLPTISRPYVVVKGSTCDDDLTVQYMEIVKINNHIGEAKKKGTLISEASLSKDISSLKFRIKTLCDNNQGKAKRHTNGRPLKALKERLSGKEGLLRGNLMGKRVNQSGRTVISPEPTLKLGELAVPVAMANNLTISETVCDYNIELLSSLVNSKKAKYVIRGDKKFNLKYPLFKKGTELLENDIIIRKEKEIENKILIRKNTKFTLKEGDRIIRKGVELKEVEYPKINKFSLKIGDIVERYLKDGDIVIFNRQPTLHRSSMMAFNIVVLPGKTLRFNLCNTKVFSADFDGSRFRGKIFFLAAINRRR